MTEFGFGKKEKKHAFRDWIEHIQPFFLILLVLGFGLANIVHMGRQVSHASGGLDRLMERVALYISPYEPELAGVVYHARTLMGAIEREEALFPTYRENFSGLFAGLQESRTKNILGTMQQKTNIPVQLAADLALFDEDVLSLLGQDGPETYLIILQNTAEKRPNGGFFGSFGVVTIDKGRVERFEIIDSYLPGFDKPGTYVTGPEWILNFLPEREIYFIGANKIGFTYHDGPYIQSLYEKSYPGQRVRGVIFVSTDMFADNVPGFREQMREWQFINASVDLIRGTDRWGKKEFYLSSANEYFSENKEVLVTVLLKNMQSILDKRQINMYLTDISGPMHARLRGAKLTTRFEEDHMYFWDSNISFSKVDTFAQKIVQFRDASGNVVIETMEDIVSIKDLAPGDYTVSIIYNLHVPEDYVRYIRSLEEEYAIELTEREIHILALIPRWATRGVVYMPNNITVTSISGDQYHQAEFVTPFSKNVYYKAKMLENNAVGEVVMKIRIE